MRKVFILFICSIAFFTDSQTIETTEKPISIGVQIEQFSKQLDENRILNIYLPVGYSPGDTTKYSVIYLLDGSIDEDFIHVAGLVQFMNFPWLNLVPNSIVVGISNVDRKRDFTFPTTIDADKLLYPTTGESANFMLYIEKEVIPFIEKSYPTTDDKMLVGQSLGGLLATEILFKKPDLFSKYLIMSPSLWWDNESLFALKQVPFSGQSPKVFVAVGKEGKIMEKDASRLYKTLKKQKMNVAFEYFGKQDHASIAHQAIYKGFEFLSK